MMNDERGLSFIALPHVHEVQNCTGTFTRDLNHATCLIQVQNKNCDCKTDRLLGEHEKPKLFICQLVFIILYILKEMDRCADYKSNICF